MNIYTVTFCGGNYGSILQAYALQSRLKEFGGHPTIITHKKPKTRFAKLQSMWRILRPEKHYTLFRRIQRTFQAKNFKEKKSKLNQFACKNLSVKTVIDTARFISTLSSQDIFIAGSDQIWSTLNHPLSEWYALGWVNDNYKKYSYAASIGIASLTIKQKQEYAKALSGFRVLSFRETQAFEALSDIFPSKARQDIDPVLLYDGNFWRQFKSSRPQTEPYIFVYMLRPDEKVIKLAKDVAKERNCKILYTGQFADKFKGITTICNAGIEEFLSYIDHAEAIVTNSFHGTAFSILFGKPFLSVKVASTSSRAEDLLSMLGLTTQFVTDINLPYSLSIDYAHAYMILERERAKSLKYLQAICLSKL